MVRTQIQLDDVAYRLVKARAHSENRSMASVIRDAVDAYVAVPEKRVKSLSELSFVASGRSDPNDKRSGSIHHDDIFVESILE